MSGMRHVVECVKVGVYKEAKNRVGGTYGLRDCGRAGGPGSEQKAGVGAKFLFFKIFLSPGFYGTYSPWAKSVTQAETIQRGCRSDPGLLKKIFLYF